MSEGESPEAQDFKLELLRPDDMSLSPGARRIASRSLVPCRPDRSPRPMAQPAQLEMIPEEELI